MLWFPWPGGFQSEDGLRNIDPVSDTSVNEPEEVLIMGLLSFLGLDGFFTKLMI